MRSGDGFEVKPGNDPGAFQHVADVGTAGQVVELVAAFRRELVAMELRLNARQDAGELRAQQRHDSLDSKVDNLSRQIQRHDAHLAEIDSTLSEQARAMRRLRDDLSDSIGRVRTAERIGAVATVPRIVNELAPTGAPFTESERNYRPATQVAQ